MIGSIAINTKATVSDPTTSDHRLLLKYSMDFYDPNATLGRLGYLSAMSSEFERMKTDLEAKGYSSLEITRLIQHGSILDAALPAVRWTDEPLS